MLYENSFNENDLNPNNKSFKCTGEYVERYRYEDGRKTEEVVGLKIKVQLMDETLFYPILTVLISETRFNFKAYDIVSFENLTAKFVKTFGNNNLVELQAEAKSIKLVK